jgi:hypothetical protein
MRLAYPDESLQLVLVDGDLEALLAVHRDDGDPDPVSRTRSSSVSMSTSSYANGSRARTDRIALRASSHR